MNRQILQDKLKSLQTDYQLSQDHIESLIITAQIELLKTILDAVYPTNDA